MVLGGGWAWLAASCCGSWPGHSDVVVMGIGLRAWFVGLQQRWSVRLRACLSLVQLHYGSYYSRHYLMYSDSLQVYNCLVVMEFRLSVGLVYLLTTGMHIDSFLRVFDAMMVSRVISW